jgi:putative SOS response-associated peptidase YedK
VPASSYCEPDSGKPAKWHWFAVNGEEDRRQFAFPGIWQRWNGPGKKDGPNVEMDVYSFMTTAPNSQTRSITNACRCCSGRFAKSSAASQGR